MTLTLGNGTFDNGSSSATAVASSGVATFSNLKIDIPGSYTLSAADGSLTPTGASKLPLHNQPGLGRQARDPDPTGLKGDGGHTVRYRCGG